ncbi:MAG: hypothetical protein GY756_19640 [bacterium]|nr:hypothetical protein [bacterium]
MITHNPPSAGYLMILYISQLAKAQHFVHKTEKYIEQIRTERRAVWFRPPKKGDSRKA